jgi:DNA damage-regulated autophagy modulator protein 2
MAASPLLRKARKVVPIMALAIALVTLFGCVLIAKAKGVYLSGMFWPFFSNTGRDKPAYYLFCAGLTTTAVLVAVTYGFNYQYQIAALRNAVGENTRKHQGMAMGTLAAGVLSVFGLSLLVRDCSCFYRRPWELTIECLCVL